MARRTRARETLRLLDAGMPRSTIARPPRVEARRPGHCEFDGQRRGPQGTLPEEVRANPDWERVHRELAP